MENGKSLQKPELEPNQGTCPISLKIASKYLPSILSEFATIQWLLCISPFYIGVFIELLPPLDYYMFVVESADIPFIFLLFKNLVILSKISET